MHPLLVQTGIAAPLVFALLVYVARDRDRGAIHGALSWLLAMILSWMIGLVLGMSEDAPQPLTSLLVIVPSCFMSPLFLLLMLLYARIEIFERESGARWALMAPFGISLIAFFTHDYHGLMLDPGRVTTRAGIADEAGPLFWAFQFWSNSAAIVGLAISVYIGWSTHSPSERRRMWLLCLGAAVPLVAHLSFVLGLLPTDYPLTPSAVGITAILLVGAIHRYKLLDVQPIARRDVLEASSDGVIVADVDELVVDLNPAAAELLGAERNEICGASLADALARLGPNEPDGALSELLAKVRSGETPPRIEVESGDGRVLEMSAGLPNDASGVRAGTFVVMRDRSSERRAERMLYQGQKLESVGILAAGVAHEVNNPLAFVRANFEHLRHLSDLVQDELDDLPKQVAEELREMPDVIDESVAGLDRIREIVQGLLRFSRMPTRQRVEWDVNESVLEAARFAALDRAAPVSLETRLCEDLPRVSASPDQLMQVLLNLFLNAGRALRDREDPRVVVETREAQGWVEIRVSDNGPGVPESIRDNIFDPFFTTGAPNEGTGLGLAISFDIVREHGGELELENPPEGGACFVLRLPRLVGSAVSA